MAVVNGNSRSWSKCSPSLVSNKINQLGNPDQATSSYLKVQNKFLTKLMLTLMAQLQNKSSWITASRIVVKLVSSNRLQKPQVSIQPISKLLPIVLMSGTSEES